MTVEHSENYEKVRDYYKRHLWNLKQVRNAVGKWITEKEYQEITGNSFK